MSRRETAQQDKLAERAFFSRHANAGQYNALTEKSSRSLIRRCLELSGLKPGSMTLDLGCGSGVFTQLLQERGLQVAGLDLSEALVAVGKQRAPHLPFIVGDAETLPVRSGTLDGLVLSGLIHHLPDPAPLAREAYRVLKPGGVFAAFDPNRHNPFMRLYRDRSSPFYSCKGLTPNERPIIAGQVARVFGGAGFSVSTDYCSVAYRYIASAGLRWILPLYNLAEAVLFHWTFLKPYRAFVLTYGVKPSECLEQETAVAEAEAGRQRTPPEFPAA